MKAKTADIILFSDGIRRIDEFEFGNIVTRREGKRVSVNRAQVGEIQRLFFKELGKIWAVDPVAVIGTIEAHKPRKASK